MAPVCDNADTQNSRPSSTCTVQAIVVGVAGRVGVGDELLGGQVGELEVLARQLDAADHQLTRHANWHQLQLGIQNVAVHVGNGLPDGHRCAALELSRDVVAWSTQTLMFQRQQKEQTQAVDCDTLQLSLTCGIHGGLCRPVCVMQMRARQALHKPRC